MKNYINTEPISIDTKKYFDTDKICFLDIETTGFSREKSFIYLTGILLPHNGHLSVNQIFIDNPNEEDELLKEVMKITERYKYIITYNGDNFDLPFLNYKYKKYNIDYKISYDKSIDLYRIIKKENDFLGLKDLKLKSVEKYLNIFREDKISGKECTNMYYKYMNQRNEDLKRKILLHNYEDIKNLPKLLSIFNIIEDKKTVEMSVSSKPFKIILEEMNIQDESLEIKFQWHGLKNIPIIYFDENFSLKYDPTNKEGILILQSNQGLLSNNKKCLYLNLSNFPELKPIKDSTSFCLPENIILLKADKILITDNIINIVKNIIAFIVKKPSIEALIN